jgi:hypothetical protein
MEMTRMKLTLTASALLASLFGIGTLMDNHGAAHAADVGPTVTIGAPLPVPVSGSVAITGTPAVNVNNTPNVRVVNSASSPALTSSLDDPGRTPYQAAVTTFFCQHFFGGQICDFSFPPVPSNRRLVIEHVGGQFTFTAVATVVFAAVGTPHVLGSRFPIPQVTVAPGAVFTVFDQAVKGYFDATTLQPGVSVSFLGTADLVATGNASFATLTGYLLDCAAAPCSPIAP